MEIILCNISPLDKVTMTFTPFTVETLRSLTLNEICMGRIKLATRSCFWVDPLVKPVRLAALNRIVYDKPIRKQLILSKLVQTNDNHMNLLERIALEAKLYEFSSSNQEEVIKQSEPTTTSDREEMPQERAIPEVPHVFKPFLNRTGQLIINPVGRSKEFFIKHNQQLQHLDFVRTILAENNKEPSSIMSSKDERSTVEDNNQIDRFIPLGHEYRINTKSSVSEHTLYEPQSTSVSNTVGFHHSKEHSPFQSVENTQQSSTESTNSILKIQSDSKTKKMTQIETKNEQVQEQEDETFEVMLSILEKKIVSDT